jgi:hypothetical protein
MTVRLPAPRRKYGNQPRAGYASSKEAKRAVELALLVKAGLITDLRRQTRWPLIPAQDGERGIDYISDFDYYEKGVLVVEDVKSEITRRNREYIIKRKLMLYFHKIRILET